MPSNHTPNYALNQWERDDRILMDDFNADNAKIDAAIKAEVDARTAADAALQAALAKKGNVWAEFYTYTGNGTYGGDNPCHICWFWFLGAAMMTSCSTEVWSRQTITPTTAMCPGKAAVYSGMLTKMPCISSMSTGEPTPR